VLELGSGTGAVGLYAAALGASRVVLTDGGPPALLELLAANVDANRRAAAHVQRHTRCAHVTHVHVHVHVHVPCPCPCPCPCCPCVHVSMSMSMSMFHVHVHVHVPCACPCACMHACACMCMWLHPPAACARGRAPGCTWSQAVHVRLQPTHIWSQAAAARGRLPGGGAAAMGHRRGPATLGPV
jgi:hypothetical protein